MKKNKFFKIKLFSLVAIILVLSGLFFTINYEIFKNDFAKKHMDDKRMEYIEEKDAIIQIQISKGNYACCLENPCAYCIEKTPGHGEGAICNCLEDVIMGRHPCGECIGEILEGHGNKFLAKYFAESITEEVGEDYKDSLKHIIQDKYGVSVQDQI